jgi:hypothetical protein
MLTILRITVAVGTLVFAATGCGAGNSPDDGAAFRRAYAAQSLKVKAIGEGVGVAITRAEGQTDAEVAATFGALAARAHDSAHAIGALNAPGDVQADVTTLQRAVDRAAADLDAIVAGAMAGDAAAAATASQALVTDSGPIRDARAAVDRAVKE